MSRPPLHALQAFVAIARSRNLTRAAAQLNLTVSALSHQMRALEQRLNQRLLLRGPRGVTLTPHGERLLESIAPHIDGIEHVFVRLRERNADALTISALPLFSSSWLMPRLPAFMASHPGLEFNLQTSVTLVDFEREPVDAALRLGSGQWPGLTAEHLFDEWIVPMASPKLVAGRRKPKPGEMASWPLIGESDDDNARWRRWFAQFGGSPPKRYAASFTEAELLHRAAAEGMGIVLGRLILAKPLVDNGTLVVLTDQRMPAGYGHYLVYPQRSAEHAPLLAFRDWLHPEIRKYLSAERIHARRKGKAL
ncbi:MAG TPA: LysR substrate-binding domain-containing protein [Rudaea sp.]|jgi:LysR family glycine cleavage system transcriptional activator